MSTCLTTQTRIVSTTKSKTAFTTDHESLRWNMLIWSSLHSWRSNTWPGFLGTLTSSETKNKPAVRTDEQTQMCAIMTLDRHSTVGVSRSTPPNCRNHRVATARHLDRSHLINVKCRCAGDGTTFNFGLE